LAQAFARYESERNAALFRVMYVAKFGETVYVLHCFQKKTQKTSSADLEIATRRYKKVQKEHGS
jgi:phage-related protein